VRKIKRGDSTLRESDLYAPIRDWLVEQGYIVRGEVKDCDITAVKGEDLIIIELKRAFGISLLVQGAQRQRATDSVYVAFPRPPGGIYTRHWRAATHLLRRLELGLILVAFGGRIPEVEVVFHPLPYERKKAKKHKRAILTEIAGRSGDFNEGGTTRRKRITAYRENALHIAYLLEQNGPLAPRKLRELGTGTKTLSILSSNFYGWFERVERGIYRITQQGSEELKAYPHVVSRFAASERKA
jgi:hypothetical protein